MTSPARLSVVRTPDRPGPGPMSAALLRALEFDIRRRIDGMLAGDFRAALLGAGTELAQVRRYEPGDDVRQLEWNVTARTGEPHVRVQIAERALTAWVLLDVSASMSFGTSQRRKADVAEGVALALGHLATRRGNRLGLITFGGPKPRIVRPSQGRLGMLGLLVELRREPSPEGLGATSLATALRRAAGIMRSRSAVFIVSDFRGPRDWKRPLTRIAERHHVMAIEIGDPREQTLPGVGDLWLMDPETGRQTRVDTSQRSVRERFEQAALQERREVRRLLTATGSAHVELSTSGDWLRTLAAHLGRRRVFR